MSLTMTEAAAKALKSHKDAVQAGPEMFLRVKLVAGGCSGHEHKLVLDTQYDDAKDSKYDFYGEAMVVDKKSELYMDGATLDYVETLEQRGFHLALPMAKKTCGCGHSHQF